MEDDVRTYMNANLCLAYVRWVWVALGHVMPCICIVFLDLVL